MPLIKASRPNLSTSCYSTEGNKFAGFSSSSPVQESKYSQRKQNKEERGKKALYMDVWVWAPILSSPGRLSRASIFCRCLPSPTQSFLGETYLLETTLNPQEDPGFLNLSVALELPLHCLEEPAPRLDGDGSGKGCMLSGCEGSSLPSMKTRTLCLSHQLLFDTVACFGRSAVSWTGLVENTQVRDCGVELCCFTLQT